MYCLKCGKETGSEKIFCESCLASMEKYPVKPGTHIQLPRRDAPVTVKKQARRRSLNQDEIIRRQKRALRILSACLLVVSILLTVCALALFSPESPLPENNGETIGRNYTVGATR